MKKERYKKILEERLNLYKSTKIKLEEVLSSIENSPIYFDCLGYYKILLKNATSIEKNLILTSIHAKSALIQRLYLKKQNKSIKNYHDKFRKELLKY